MYDLTDKWLLRLSGWPWVVIIYQFIIIKKLFRYCIEKSPLTENHNRIFSGLMWSLWSINYNLWVSIGNTRSIWVDWCPNHHTLRSFQVAVCFIYEHMDDFKSYCKILLYKSSKLIISDHELPTIWRISWSESSDFIL